jgi:hypothetical protein
MLAFGLLAVGFGVSLWLALDWPGGQPQNAGNAPASTQASTYLRILAINTALGRASFTFSCDPPGGNLPRVREACAALGNNPALITNPKPFTCIGGEYSWWDVSITGHLAKQTVRRSFSTCWTPQMPTIAGLGLRWPVLRSHTTRRQQAVLGGTSRTFAPGLLRPGDLVTCNFDGHHWELGIPNAFNPLSQLHFTGPLIVHRKRDGSVIASCRFQRS